MEQEMSPREFENQAKIVMERHFGVDLQKGSLPDVPKVFDMVSMDRSIIGDAKYFALVGRERIPPAKFSTIAEYVWLLEKTNAGHKFLIFGNQKEVPVLWLKKYGHLVDGVEFYFLSDDGQLERLSK